MLLEADGRLRLEWDAYFSRVESRITALEESAATLENPVIFKARPSVNQTAGNGAFTQLTFGTEDIDTHDAFASSVFTAPVAGRYLLIGQAAIDFSGGAGDTWIFLIKNGSTTLSGGRVSGSPNTYLNVVTIDQAAAGDTYRVDLYQASTGNQTVLADRTYFCGHLIAAT